MRRAALCSVMVISLLVVSTSPAIASSVRDPADARGRLDVTFVSATNVERQGLVKVRVDTERGYGCRFLSTRKPNRLFILFDVHNDGDVDDIGRFFCSSDHQWMLRVQGVGGILVGSHPDADTLVFNVGWEFISGDQEATHGSVVIRSRDESSEGCRHTPCMDRAPNLGGLAAW
jgi:hypothetical protein